MTQKRRGRPPTGQAPTITVRLDLALVARIEAWAAVAGVSRSEAIRALVEAELERRERAGG